MKNCYTYCIKWTKYGKWYYGRRTAKQCNPAELWHSYFTSSHHVKSFRALYGDPDIIEIRKQFGVDVSGCISWEHKVLRRLKVQHRPDALNMHIGGGKFDTTGLAIAICAKSGKNLGLQPMLAPQWNTGEWVHIKYPQNLGKCNAKDALTGTPIGKISKTDPRWQTGEIIKYGSNHAAGKTSAIEVATGRSIGLVSLTDLRWETGEIQSTNTGKKCSQHAKDVASRTHKGKVGSMLGKRHSTESKLKIGQRHYARGSSHPKSKQVSINGVVYQSLTIAVCELNVKESTLRDYLKGLYLHKAAERGIFNPHYVNGGQTTATECSVAES